MLSELDQAPGIQRGISVLDHQRLKDQKSRVNSIDADGREQWSLQLNDSSDSSSEKSSGDLNKMTIDQRLAHVRTIDELDFQYREDVQACKQCTDVNGIRDHLGFRKDRNMYKHVVKFRQLLQK